MTDQRQKELVSELKTILEDTLTNYHQLKEAIDEERNDIVNNKSLTLDDINSRKEGITGNLNILTDARKRVTQELADIMGVGLDGLTISKLLTLIPNEIAQSLVVLRDKLKELIEEVTSATSATARIIGSSVKFVQERLNIARSVKPVTTYSRRGSIQEYNLKQGNMVSYSA